MSANGPQRVCVMAYATGMHGIDVDMAAYLDGVGEAVCEVVHRIQNRLSRPVVWDLCINMRTDMRIDML